MRIIVCIKQVPESAEVKINSKTYTLDRSSVKGIINPFDQNAIEEAVQIKENFENVEVHVISMGPPSAEAALKEALTFGLDQAYLLTDKAFAGADTLATAYTLSKAIEKIGNFDLILCGKQAIDGDTAQVGPGIAENLNIPQITNAKKIEIQDNGQKAIIESEHEVGFRRIEVQLPALVTVSKEINVPRIPSFKDARRALKIPIHKWTAKDLASIEENKIGLSGSPTTVVKVESPQMKKDTFFLKGDSDEIINDLIEILRERHVI